MEFQSQSVPQPQFVQVPVEEPYMFYQGFRLGFGLDDSCLKELEAALVSHQRVVILIDDTEFPSLLFSYLQQGSSGLRVTPASKRREKRSSFCLSEGNRSRELIKTFFESRGSEQIADPFIFEQAKMQLALLDTERTELAYSLPKSFSHPALAFIKRQLEETVSLEVAPKLVGCQMERWGLDSPKIVAFSKLALENRVDS
jgi:hypothetical protein